MSRWLFPLMPLVPIPHRLLHGLLLRDNVSEHAADGWARLRNVSELGRYSVIQGACQQFAPGGSVLDVGCGEGILQERLRYGRYTGIDLFSDTIHKAAQKTDQQTRFLQADAASYVPDERYDAIVWNECLYYLARPLEVITRYRQYLRPEGVIIVSMFYQTFATRRLFRQLRVLGEVVDEVRIGNRDGASWLVRTYRPRPELGEPSRARQRLPAPATEPQSAHSS